MSKKSVADSVLGDVQVPVVLDNGSFKIKIGFAGNEFPDVDFFPLFVKHERERRRQRRPIFQRCSYLDDGPLDIQEMETHWDLAFKHLNIFDTTKHSCLLTDVPIHSELNREMMAVSMFETFGVPSLYMANQALLSLYASKRKTGMVVEVGHSGVEFVPVVDGVVVQKGVNRMVHGGWSLTDLMVDMLIERVDLSPWDNVQRLAEEIKHERCFVVPDIELAMSTPLKDYDDSHQSIELTPRRRIRIGYVRFLCPEALFQPSLLGAPWQRGIHRFTYDAILACDERHHKALFGNIVLAGNNSLFRGLANILREEIMILQPSKKKYEVKVDQQDANSAWRGGSLLASQPSFEKICISRSEYEEYGPAILHAKCHSAISSSVLSAAFDEKE